MQDHYKKSGNTANDLLCSQMPKNIHKCFKGFYTQVISPYSWDCFW